MTREAEAENLLRALFQAIQEKDQVRMGKGGISGYAIVNAKIRTLLIEIVTFLQDKYTGGLEAST